MATSTTTTQAALLQRIMQLDAFVSLFGAFAFAVVGISPLGSLLGFQDEALPLIIAVALVIYTVWLLWAARRPDVQTNQAMLVVIINDIWVLGSIAILVFNLLPLTLLGKVFVGLIAVVVAAFGILEFYALRKQKS